MKIDLGPRPECPCGRGKQEDEGWCVRCIHEMNADCHYEGDPNADH